MNKTITLCNHCAESNKYGKPLGHSLKVTREYFELLKDWFDRIELGAVGSIADNSLQIGFDNISKLPYEINVDAPFTLSRRIKDKMGFFNNIKECLNSDTDAVFFYQGDFFLYFYLCFRYRRRPNKKLYALAFRDDFSGGKIEWILQKVFKKGITKLDGLIYTMPTASIEHVNKIWISDYLYSEEKYGYLRKLPKEKKVVCLGTMNRYKDLEGVVKVFSNTDIRVEIIGAFDEKERIEAIKRMASDNILIEDRVLEDNEYYEKMATAAYGILPYDMNQYHNRTSGVLLETLFVGSIPIAPRELLDNNDCDGIPYDEILKLDVNRINTDDLDIYTKKQLSKISDCSIEATQERLCSFLMGEQ